jgi:FkbM family methyltransferase
MSLIVRFGVEHAYMDVTNKALLYNAIYIKNPTTLCLPANDYERIKIFTDHLEGVQKHIIITYNQETSRFDNGQHIEIPLHVSLHQILSTATPDEKLSMIHRNTYFMYGKMYDELPEQIMASTFIRPENIVLELGANVGRNTIIISCLLNDSSQLVTLETDRLTCNNLENNKDINELHFTIENSALSNRFLIQRENSWDTEVRDTNEVPEGYNKVNTITFTELTQKHNKVFDTLVADCEGALYYIFQDFPNMLTDIQTIIMENDYHDPCHKMYVNDFLINNGFTCVYRKSGGWGPCYGCFFETWKKVL